MYVSDDFLDVITGSGDSFSNRYVKKTTSNFEAYSTNEPRTGYDSSEHQSARRHNRTVADVKAEYDEKLNDYKLQAKRKAKIEAIRSVAFDVARKFENTKAHHIPDALINPVYDIMNQFYFMSSKTLLGEAPTKTDIRLDEMMTKLSNVVANYNDHEGNSVSAYVDMPEGFKKTVDGFVATLQTLYRGMDGKQYVLEAMSMEELENAHTILCVLRSFINNTNSTLAMEQRKEISKLSYASRSMLDKLGNHANFGEITAPIAKWLNWSNLLPVYAFKRYYGEDIFRSIMDGQDKLAYDSIAIKNFTEKTYKPDEVKKWRKQVFDFEILQPLTEEQRANGEKPRTASFKMTATQLMSLYCLDKREQGGKHIYDGGIRIGNVDAIKGEQDFDIKLTHKDVQSMLEKLSPRQKEVADALQHFMSTVTANWGNEITYKRFGIESFLEKHYFPVESSDTELNSDHTESSGASNNNFYRLLNMSFTKPLTEYARNVIIINDAFQVFSQHTSDMAKYHSLALPVLDAVKWYNYSELSESINNGQKQITKYSVKKSMKDAYGKAAKIISKTSWQT